MNNTKYIEFEQHLNSVATKKTKPKKKTAKSYANPVKQGVGIVRYRYDTLTGEPEILQFDGYGIGHAALILGVLLFLLARKGAKSEAKQLEAWKPQPLKVVKPNFCNPCKVNF